MSVDAADTGRAQLARTPGAVDADAAADHLGIRRTDLDYLVSGGLIRPVHRRGQPGPDDNVDADGAYLVADLEALLANDTVDWEALRAVEWARPSPLLKRWPPLQSRDQAIEGLAERLTQALGVRVEAAWCARWIRNSRDGGWWEIHWWAEGGRPTEREVADAIATDAAGAQYLRIVNLVQRNR